MCNQAADLDSIACCVSLAVSLDAAPFVPIPREELHLRREAEWLLDKCGVDTASLAFSGELDPSEADKIILVDHNVLPKNLATLLLGAILIDTRCLAQRHPTTELDRSVAAQLAAVAGCDSKALYAELWRLKSDLSVFTPGELLRKDCKEINRKQGQMWLLCNLRGPGEHFRRPYGRSRGVPHRPPAGPSGADECLL